MAIELQKNVTKKSEKQILRSSTLYWSVIIILVVIALITRLWNLGILVSHDYDEGVYWQSLRAMSEGHLLYKDIFYSQPPFFLLSIYPFYLFFGQDIFAARLGIMCMSMLGIVAMSWLGRLLHGKTGQLIALLLMVIQPGYLILSQTLQAEIPALFFSILAVALGYQWWKTPQGWRGWLLSTLAGGIATLALLSKLLGVIVFLPLILIFLCSFRAWSKKTRAERRAILLAVPFLLVGCLISATLICFPFLAHWQELIRGVITFHTDAERLSDASANNPELLLDALLTPLLILAITGAVLAIRERDWRLLPLLGWFAGSIFLLARQDPLFDHHLVFLYPPLIAIGVLGFPQHWQFPRWWQARDLVIIVACIALIGMSLRGGVSVARYTHNPIGNLQEKQDAINVLQIAQDLERATQPGDLVLTDSQFLVALANRSTPASLVDTSNVRRESGYLPVELLLTEMQRPEVKAVLIYTGRLNDERYRLFDNWLNLHYERFVDYSNGRALWLKKNQEST